MHKQQISFYWIKTIAKLNCNIKDPSNSQTQLYRLFQILLSIFPSSSDPSTHFYIENPSLSINLSRLKMIFEVVDVIIT